MKQGVKPLIIFWVVVAGFSVYFIIHGEYDVLWKMLAFFAAITLLITKYSLKLWCLVLFTLFTMAGCWQRSCPTYDGVKRRGIFSENDTSRAAPQSIFWQFDTLTVN